MYGEEWSRMLAVKKEKLASTNMSRYIDFSILNSFTQMENLGLVPRVSLYLLQKLDAGAVRNIRISYYQIYNEKVVDMIGHKHDNDGMSELIGGDKADGDGIRIREGVKGDVQIDGLEEAEIEDIEGLIEVLRIGETNREKRRTSLNESSSRSHTVFSLKYKLSESLGSSEHQITLCDLAGSEKFTDDQLKDKSHQLESRHINQSLAHLGR